MKHSIFLLSAIFIVSPVLAQNKKATELAPQPPVGIEAKVMGMKKQPGFFDFYYDEKTDKTHLVVSQLNQEFLYVQSLTAAIGSNDIGLDRNQLGRERVVKFEKRGPKLLLIEPNTLYRANRPPRPLGYERHREVIKIKTGLTFDALALAEAAADITLGMVLRPERANRLVEHHARNPVLPSLESILDKLINATIKAPVKTGYEGAVQMTTNHALFVCLAVLLQHEEASAQSKAITGYKLNQLKLWLTSQAVVVVDYEWKAHYSYLSGEINQLLTEPNGYKPKSLLEAPPGQPIGMDMDYCGN